MLLRLLFLCFALAVIGETILQAAASLAVVALHERGLVAASSTFITAAQLAQSTIANAVAQGATPPPLLPSPTPTCVLGDGATCATTTTASVVLATPSPTACPSDGCTYLEENDAVAEGRVDATITATVSDASGATVATRSGTVAFRTLNIAPYAIPVGALDATLDDAGSGAGDLGGIVPSGTAAGTLIDVVYQNADSGAIMPASVWSGRAPAAQSVSAWSP